LQPLIRFIFSLPANPVKIGNPAGIVVEKQEIINSCQLRSPFHRKLLSIAQSDSLILLPNGYLSHIKIGIRAQSRNHQTPIQFTIQAPTPNPFLLNSKWAGK
jgi:hypothetical protein